MIWWMILTFCVGFNLGVAAMCIVGIGRDKRIGASSNTTNRI